MGSRSLAALLALAAPFVLAHAAQATVPGGNLVKNGDAEAAPGSNDSGTVSPIPGWTVTGPFTSVAYGAPAFPDATVAAAVNGGKNFFAGGPSTASGSATQDIDVSGAAKEIDGGTVKASLSGVLGGFSSQGDNTVVSAQFLGASGNDLGSPVSIGPVSAADRQNVSNLLPRSADGAVPAGTRTIRITITATRTEGSYDDGYSDNIGLTLSGGTPTTPPPAPPPPPPPPATPQAPTTSPGPRDVEVQPGPGGSFRIQVQYQVRNPCASPCKVHAEIRTRTGARRYRTKLPGDGRIVLGTRSGLTLPKGRKVRFYVTISKAALLKVPFVTQGGFRVGETRLRVWLRQPGQRPELLTVRDGHIKVSIARIKSGALPGLKGIL
jgi:hypothetical protein